MKLQEFFDTQKHTTYSDIDKLDLYQNILYKKTKKTSLKRSSFVHAKYFVYSMVFVVLMMGLYGVYFMNNGTLQDSNRFAIKTNSTNTAQADYIAQVINVEGSFFIEHNGVLATTSNIGNGDTVLLKEDAQLVFEINSGTQSKIIGPAKLVIQKTNTDNYKLNLIYGNFIQMEGKEEKAQTIELAINDITVKQQDKSQPLNFKFIKNGKNEIFQNNGSNIIVTKSNGKDKETTISKEQVVAIQNNDIKVFANIDKFTKAVQEKDISQTFALVEETNSGTSNQEEATLISLLNTPQIIESKDDITQNISSVVLSGEKDVLELNQYEKISSILYEGSYSPELKNLEGAFVWGNDEAFDIAYAKIEKRVQTIYQSFDATYSRQEWNLVQKLEGLKTAIEKIKNKITDKYNVPPKYIENFQNIEKTLDNIVAQWYGSASTHNAAVTGEEIQQ